MHALLCLALAAAIAAGCTVRTGHPPHGAPRVTGDLHVSGNRSGHASLSLSFSDRDQRLIHDYYRTHTPPGLAKKGKIPPGLAKQGKTPPGHSKRPDRHHRLDRQSNWTRLPAALRGRLAPLPDGYIHIRVDDAIAIMELETRLILDVLHPM